MSNLEDMSDFTIIGPDEEFDHCYGSESYKITEDDIAALRSGKKLYATVNCGEYAIIIEMK